MHTGINKTDRYIYPYIRIAKPEPNKKGAEQERETEEAAARGVRGRKGGDDGQPGKPAGWGGEVKFDSAILYFVFFFCCQGGTAAVKSTAGGPDSMPDTRYHPVSTPPASRFCVCTSHKYGKKRCLLLTRINRSTNQPIRVTRDNSVEAAVTKFINKIIFLFDSKERLHQFPHRKKDTPGARQEGDI